MSAPQALALELRRQRADGATFADPWNIAVPIALAASFDASDWLPVFAATRAGWESAYTRGPTRRRHRGLVAISHGDDGPLEPQDTRPANYAAA